MLEYGISPVLFILIFMFFVNNSRHCLQSKVKVRRVAYLLFGHCPQFCVNVKRDSVISSLISGFCFQK